MKVMRTNESIDLVRPLVNFQKLLTKLQSVEEFLVEYKKVIINKPLISYTELYESLSDYDHNLKLIKEFTLKYNLYSFDERRVESATIAQSPLEFFKLLNWYYYSNNIPYPNFQKIYELKNIGFINLWIISKLQRLINNRSKLSYIRRKYFYNLRQIYIKMTNELSEDLKLNGQKIDQFANLSIEDLLRYGRNEIDLERLREIMNSPMESNSCTSANNDSSQGFSGNNINGVGRILKLDKPSDALKYDDLSDRIIVLKSATPFWIFIFAKAAGIIAEESGQLSYSAMMGRELGLPTIIGYKNAYDFFQDDEKVEIKSKDGTVVKLEIES